MTTSPLVAAYLADLDRALADADPSDRLEIVDAVREHIDAALAELGASATQAQVAGVLRRLGTADDVAAAWAAGADRPGPGRAGVGAQLRPSTHGPVPSPQGEARAAASPWLVALVVILGLVFGVPLVLGLLGVVFVAAAPVGAGALSLLAVAATITSGIVWRRAARNRGAWLAAFLVAIVLSLGTAALDARVLAGGDPGSGFAHGGVSRDVPTLSPGTAGLPVTMP